jgi:hypothetical protein
MKKYRSACDAMQDATARPMAEGVAPRQAGHLRGWRREYKTHQTMNGTRCKANPESPEREAGKQQSAQTAKGKTRERIIDTSKEDKRPGDDGG